MLYFCLFWFLWPCVCSQPQILWLDCHFFAFLLIQHHHVAAPSVVKRGRYPGLAIQVLPACAGDHHLLAEERALGADFLVDQVQCFVGG